MATKEILCMRCRATVLAVEQCSTRGLFMLSYVLGHAHEDLEDAVYGDPMADTERKEVMERVALGF